MQIKNCTCKHNFYNFPDNEFVTLLEFLVLFFSSFLVSVSNLQQHF